MAARRAGAVRGVTDAKLLLERHKPRLVYDSLEAYFAGSAAIWTDFGHTRLRRADGTVLVTAPQLSLAFLGPHAYGDGRPVRADDVIGETSRDYTAHAAQAQADVRYRNRVHGRARRDDRQRLWLQYWCFYYYNDFQLAGPLLSGGKHEGDWEMVQLRLDADERPVEAVYTQHKAGESRPWSAVEKAPSSADTPLVYVARGSHANYFTAGSHWTGVWFDNADGRGPGIDPAVVVLGDNSPGWALWPGWWGDTKASSSPVDANSPRGPGRHKQWGNPALLAGVAARAAAAARPAAPAPTPPPAITVRREGDRAVVAFEAQDAKGLVVAIRPAGSDEPARTVTVPVSQASGEVEVELGDDRAFEVHASAAAQNGSASPGAAGGVPAR
jgi:hypothetical protein